MRDREVVASVVAGDPAGLAEAYDKYASVLYTYSKTFLHEPADAADVVHDTFVIAAGNLGRLRDPDRLRPWLYAVTRNLCLRKLRTEKAVAAEWSDIDLAPSDSEDTDIGGDAERAELRALLRAAGGGLNSGERDMVELRLWQGLDTAEAAAVLGITRGHAHALMSRGRDQLTASVGALLVARMGREECATLDRLLSGWDGELTVLLRKRLTRHIEHCDICSDRQRRELQPALLSLWPAGVLAGDALARHAMHVVAVPADLKARVLATAASNNTTTTAAKAAGLAGGGRGVRENGFPRPAAAHRLMPARGTHAHLTLWTAGGAAAAVVVASAVYAGTHVPGGPGGRPGSALGLGGSVTTSGPGRGPGGTAPPGSTGGQDRPGSGSPGTGGPGSGPGASGGPSGSPGSGGGGIVPVVTLKPVAQPSPGSSATPTSSASSSSPSSAPSSSSPAPPPPSSSSPAAPPASSSPPTSSPPVQAPAQGTLTVSPDTIVLTPLLGSSLTLTAEGGPVSWSISEPASLLGELIVSPSSGTLAAGQSTTVSISVSGLASLDTTLTVNPGGHPVTVVLGVL